MTTPSIEAARRPGTVNQYHLRRGRCAARPTEHHGPRLRRQGMPHDLIDLLQAEAARPCGFGGHRAPDRCVALAVKFRWWVSNDDYQ